MDGSLWEVGTSYEYLYAYYSQVVICPLTGELHVENKTIPVAHVSDCGESDRRRVHRLRTGPSIQPAEWTDMGANGLAVPLSLSVWTRGHRVQVKGRLHPDARGWSKRDSSSETITVTKLFTRFQLSIAKLPGDNEAPCKQLVVEGELLSTGAKPRLANRIMEMQEGTEIIGLVIFSGRRWA